MRCCVENEVLQLINMELFQVYNKSWNNSGGHKEEEGFILYTAAENPRVTGAKHFFQMLPPTTVDKAKENNVQRK